MSYSGTRELASFSGSCVGLVRPNCWAHEVPVLEVRPEPIEGGTGTAAAVYTGNRQTCVLAKTGSGFTVIDNSGLEGTDALQNEERLKFCDRGIALDVGATQPAGENQLLLGVVLGKGLLAQKRPLIGPAIDLMKGDI